MSLSVIWQINTYKYGNSVSYVNHDVDFCSAHGVPSTLPPSCGTDAELVRVKRGDTLYLYCGSHCSETSSREHSYTWWKVSDKDGKKQQLSFTGAAITEDDVTGESGGEYECKCGNSGQTCTFYVASKLICGGTSLSRRTNKCIYYNKNIYCCHKSAVLPEVTFTSSHTASHYGNVVTLTCAVEGYPANSSTMTNAYGIEIHSYFKKKIGNFRIETTAVIEDIEEEDYVCLVETHYNGYSIAEEKHTLKINVYSEFQLCLL